MTWTATLKDVQRGEVSWAYVVVYSDGQQTIVKQYTAQSLDDTEIASTARNEIAGFAAVSGSAGKIALKPGDVIDLTKPVPVQPTPEQVARAAFDTAHFNLQRLRGYADGVSSPALDQAIADAQKANQSKWQDGFI